MFIFFYNLSAAELILEFNIFSEFFFESEFRDDDFKKRKNSEGEGKESTVPARKGKTIITSKGKFAISKEDRKNPSSTDDKPLLGSATDYLLGLELSSSDDFGYLIDDFLQGKYLLAELPIIIIVLNLIFLLFYYFLLPTSVYSYSCFFFVEIDKNGKWE